MAAPMLVKLRLPKFSGHIYAANTRSFSRCQTLWQEQNASTSAVDSSPPPQQPAVPGGKKIQLPKATKRDEYTVLKTLSSTVAKGSNNPHYMYMDDPRLLPTTRHGWGSHVMSKVSGRRAAQYVIQNWPHFFEKTPMWNPDDKLPKVYFPQHTKPVLPDDTLEGLVERIEKRKPLEAYSSYEKLKDQGVEISAEVKDDLLELLCIYNSEAAPDHSDLELYFKMLAHVKDPQQMKWKEDSEADILFGEMEEPSPRAYNAMVKARATYNDAKKAYSLLMEMKEKGIKVELETYNAIFRVLHHAADAYEVNSFQRLTELLNEMKSEGLEPNLSTFNALLSSLDPRSRVSTSRAISILNEMKHCGIEPSLASWYLTLCAAYKEKTNSDPQLLAQVVEQIEQQEVFESRDFRDFRFFPQAMDACYRLRTVDLAHRVDAVMHKGNNYQFAGDFFAQDFYYRNYLETVIRDGELDDAMSLHKRLVPNVYIPKPPTLRMLLQSIDRQQGYHYLPTIWQDMLDNRSLFNGEMLSSIAQVLVKASQSEEVSDVVRDIVAGISDTIVQRVQEEEERAARFGSRGGKSNNLEIDGMLAGNLVELNVKYEDLENAWKILNIYQSQKEKVGFLSYRCIDRLLELCVKQRDVEKVLPLLRVMYDQASPALHRSIKNVQKTFQLTEAQKTFLNELN